jgi:aspartyl protease family protein
MGKNTGWIWLLVIAVLTGVVALAARAAPGALNDGDKQMQLIYLCVILAVLSGGLAARLQARPGTVLSQFGAWAVIFAGLILVYSYRDDFAGLKQRFLAELLPGQGVTVDERSVAFQAQADGHYHVYAQIDGSAVAFLVDSGASDIVLSPADARMLGMQPELLPYTIVAQSANGEVRGAPVTLNTIKVGPIVMHGVPATVNQAEMPFSLLGMEFLRRLKSWGVENGKLTFRN